MKLNFVMTEVQNNLVELEGLIANQKDNNWSEPNLVTTELGDVLNGIWLGITTGRGIRRKNRSSTVMKLNRLMEWNSKSTVSKIKKGIWSISHFF
jgi:hypothetical protein